MKRVRKQLRPRSRKMDDADLPGVVRLWLARMLVNLGGHREFVSHASFADNGVAMAIGLEGWLLANCRFDMRKAHADLRRRALRIDRTFRDSIAPSPLRENVERLRRQIGLSEVDCRILEFIVLLHVHQELDAAGGWVGMLTKRRTVHVLGVLLSLGEEEVALALRRDGVLCGSGLVELFAPQTTSLSMKLEAISPDFVAQICSSEAEPMSLLRETVAVSPSARLRLEDFTHIAPSLEVLVPYLRQAIEGRRRGVNVFIHGRPGTGKTELARTLAQELGCDIFEVSSEDSSGNAVKGEVRLRAFRVAQCFLRQSGTLVLFDEAEDVFGNDDDFFSLAKQRSFAQESKAWINRTLESNAAPTLWLSNSVSGLDPAFVRRFDLVIELAVPPRHQRERIVRDACADLVDARGIARLADSDVLAPAVIVRASDVVRSIRDQLPPDRVSTTVELLVNSTLEAQGHPRIAGEGTMRLPEVYDPAFIHSDIDPSSVVEGMRRTRQGRLCLFGPPGTGKTAYGKWLAEQLDLPLDARRASDLLSKWLGASERNVARAFREARDHRSILMIDEVDTFLQDRRRSRQSWEVSLVNEMLTQIESFPGIFIASTNLVDGLDQASLRRFDLKLRFDYLAEPQAWELLRRHSTSLGIASPTAGERERLARLPQLTPGDFAAVARQCALRPIHSPHELVAALEAECSLKEGFGRRIGFT